jgi:hypothetical protein
MHLLCTTNDFAAIRTNREEIECQRNDAVTFINALMINNAKHVYLKLGAAVSMQNLKLLRKFVLAPFFFARDIAIALNGFFS